jgi:hypothetical protein
MPGAGPEKKRSIRDRVGQAVKKTVTGDKERVEVAEKVLVAQAQQLAADGRTTTVVVIGSAEDRDKVIASLALAKRKVLVAHVDKDIEDDITWNTALSGGVVGGLGADKAQNLWVFLPRKGTPPRQKPDHVFSTTVAGGTVWNGIFAADGDEVDLDQLGGVVAREDSSSAAPAGAPNAGASLGDGDVVQPKIAGVKVFADASATSRVLGNAAKTDEFVVEGAVKNGMVKVTGASLSGWVAVTMLRKQ